MLSEIIIPPSPKTISCESISEQILSLYRCCFFSILTDKGQHIVFYPAAPVSVGSDEEDVRCSRLMFKEDFLSHQYFGENHPVSIITEKVHFGEGMHRRAFRTLLQAGQMPLLLPGHTCVLKVHNSISYGTKNNDELIEKNFTLAVEVRRSQLLTLGTAVVRRSGAIYIICFEQKSPPVMELHTVFSATKWWNWNKNYSH